MDQIRPSFVYFRPFLNTITNIVQLTINEKSVDGVVGIRTRDHQNPLSYGRSRGNDYAKVLHPHQPQTS